MPRKFRYFQHDPKNSRSMLPEETRSQSSGRHVALRLHCSPAQNAGVYPVVGGAKLKNNVLKQNKQPTAPNYKDETYLCTSKFKKF